MGKAKVNIPMCAALVLLLLTMISIHLTSGLYARYTATSTGSDSARVAKFDVTAMVDEAITLDCTDEDSTAECKITVTNNSEVAVRYSVTVVFKQVVNGTDVIVQLDGKNVDNQVDQAMSFFNVGTLMPNGTSAEHALTFYMTNWHSFTQLKNGSTAEWPLGFTVKINAEQID